MGSLNAKLRNLYIGACSEPPSRSTSRPAGGEAALELMLFKTSRKCTKGLLLLVEELVLLVHINARGTLLLALPDKHQLKFNIHKDAKSFMEAIEKRFGGNKETKKVQKTLLKKQYENFSGSSSESLDQIHDRLQKFISQLEILADLEDQSLDDLFNNLNIYEAETNSLQLDNDDLKQIDADDLEEMDLKWQMTMLTMRARRFLQRTGMNLGANRTTSIGFDMSKSLRKKFEKARLVVYQQNENVFEEDIKLLKLDVMLRDNALVELRKKFKKAEHKRDELKLTLEKIQTSSINLSKLLASQITDKTGLGYDNQVFNSIVFDCDELISSESDKSVPISLVHDRYKSGEGYHDVPPPYTRTFMPFKPDLVFHDALTVCETVPNVFHVEPDTTKPNKDLSQSNRPSISINEDWVSDSEDESKVEHPTQAKNLRKDIPKSRGHKHSWTRKTCFVCKSVNHLIKDCDYYKKNMVQNPVWNHEIRVNHQNSARMTYPHSKKHVVPTAVLTRSRLFSFNAARPVTIVVSQTNVNHQRQAKHVVNKPHSPIKRPINHRPAPKNSNFHQKVTIVKAKQVNDIQGYKGNWQALKDKGVIDSGCSRNMTENISYLSDFEEINRGYVSFGRNPKGGKITGKDTECVVLSSDFKLPDENHMLLMVPKENNMYNVDLKNIVPSGDLTCLFAKATLDESNLWHRSLGHINFKTMNKLVKSNLVRGFHQKFLKIIILLLLVRRESNIKPLVRPNLSANHYKVVAGNQPNSSAGIQRNFDAGKVGKESVSTQQYVLLPLWSTVVTSQRNMMKRLKRAAKGKSPVDLSTGVRDLSDEFEEFSVNSTNRVNTASAPVTVVRPNLTNSTNSFNVAGPSDNAEEGIDYEEVFAPVARIEAIRLFLDYASFMSFMDLKTLIILIWFTKWSKHSMGCIKLLELGMRHWANYLLENGFQSGKIDHTLFIKKEKGNILLVQVYVDDTIFGSTNKELCKAFEKLMKDKFQMSSIGELTFFLGLQVKQKDNGIFISQDKYVAEILRKFDLTDGKSASTLIDTEKPLLKDPDGEDVDVHIYRSLIGSLMYLTSSRPDIMLAVCACAHFQVTPKVSHLHAVKRIFRYLKGKSHLRLWYPKDSSFNLVAYSDSDYARPSLDRKSTTGERHTLDCVFLDFRLTMQVNKSSMKLLKWNLHVTNVSSAGSTPHLNGYQFTISNPHQELTSPD
nr:copia protein [Tanacetum cinerariifolium]